MLTKQDVIEFEKLLDKFVDHPGISFNKHDARWVAMHTSNPLRWFLNEPMRSLGHYPHNTKCKCSHIKEEHGNQTPWCLKPGCHCLMFRHEELTICWEGR